ncbi:MAG: sulfotransferase [Halioglobus sp.]
MVNSNYFVGIGAAKSGTSWLADYLYSHPQVALSPIKELHYFDARFCEKYCGHWNAKWLSIREELKEKNFHHPSPDLDEKIRNVSFRIEMTDCPTRYVDYFNSFVERKHAVFGEITPSYSILPTQGFSEILDIYPRAKFVFLMRDPVSRYLSQIRFLSQLRMVEGKKPLKGFDANVVAAEYLSKPEYHLRGDYQRTLENLLQATGQESVCVLFYEHLFEDTHDFQELTMLCDFLGIEFRPPHSTARVNASGEFEFDRDVIARIRQHFSSTYEFVDKKYGSRAPRSWNWNG